MGASPREQSTTTDIDFELDHDIGTSMDWIYESSVDRICRDSFV
jgi:hypothetical protein